MKSTTLIIVFVGLCIAAQGINCSFIKSRVFGSKAPTDPRHACVILVPDPAQPGLAKLGAGTIISDRHVLTAAHLVSGSTTFQVGHGWQTGGSMLRRDCTVANVHQGFNKTSYENDLAIVTLPVGKSFNLFTARIKAALLPAAPAAPATGFSIGWGFVAPSTNAMSASPFEAELTVGAADPCLAMFPASVTALGVDVHCATSTTYGVCPGDNGSGLYTVTTTAPILAELSGVVSLVDSTCASGGAALVQGFSQEHLDWIRTTANIPLPAEAGAAGTTIAA